MALSKKPLKIFHTSDIHLGAYDKKSGRFSDENKIKQEKNFIRLIDIDIASKADVFLIPGDLFDNARVDQETLELFAEQINRIDIPTIVAPGNHDHVGPDSVFDRINLNDIAKNQPNFKDAPVNYKAKEGDLVVFDYSATVEEKTFKGGEGKNTQLTLGKDLFLKGFDSQLTGVKKYDEKVVEATLPENFSEKELVGKIAKFKCKISSVKNPEEVTINDEIANISCEHFRSAAVNKITNAGFISSLIFRHFWQRSYKNQAMTVVQLIFSFFVIYEKRKWNEKLTKEIM